MEIGVINIFFTLVLILAFLSPQAAYAYFDPGTGSLLIQILIASVGGLLIFYNKILLKIKKTSD